MAGIAKVLLNSSDRRRVNLAKGAAAITNDPSRILHTTNRLTWARRFHDLVELYLDQLGGLDKVREPTRNLVRRCAALACEAEKIEALLARSKTVDPEMLDTYLRVTHAQARLLAQVGLRKSRGGKAKDETKGNQSNLSSYLKRKNGSHELKE